MIVGRGNITTERISIPSTLAEILLFSALYGLATLLQVGLVLVVAVLLGRLAGFAFLLTAGLLSCQVYGALAVNPLQVGVTLRQRYHASEKPEFVKVAQFLLVVIGLIVLALVAVGYFPTFWEWRITWNETRYIVMSRWSFFRYVGRWYMAGSFEIIARLLGILIAPFVGWPTLTLIRWAAQMEVTRPKFREAIVTPTTPETSRGPFGEEYRVRNKPDVPQRPVEPDAYIPMTEE